MLKKKLFQNTFAGSKVVSLIQLIDKFFAKLPHLPEKLIAIIIKIVPWPTLIFGIISAVAALSSFGFLILSVIAGDFTVVLSNLGGFLLILLSTCLLLKAFKPLRQKSAIGWIYLFWIQLINIAYSSFDIITGQISPWWTIGNIIVFTYVLFEIGPSYMYRGEK